MLQGFVAIGFGLVSLGAILIYALATPDQHTTRSIVFWTAIPSMPLVLGIVAVRKRSTTAAGCGLIASVLLALAGFTALLGLWWTNAFHS